jgi:acetyl-CoA carboxylase carboxyltransferase component
MIHRVTELKVADESKKVHLEKFSSIQNSAIILKMKSIIINKILTASGENRNDISVLRGAGKRFNSFRIFNFNIFDFSVVLGDSAYIDMILLIFLDIIAS